VTTTPEIPNADPAAGAPGYLELVRVFVNSVDLESGIDDLSTGAEATAWLVQHGVIGAGDDVDDQGAAALRRLREALRDLVEFGDDADRSGPARAAVQAEVAGPNLAFSVDDDGRLGLQPVAGSPLEVAIATVATIVHDSMVDGTWGRVKVCHDHGCRWLFFDHSKNRSRTWCSMEVCGNRNKARALRRRRAAVPPSVPPA
jgi:predicted RNA-binding Zn ribbon-like protein